MELQVIKKEFSDDHKVYYFTFRVDITEYSQVYLTGYLDFYDHFRITDSHSTEVKELAQAIVFVALNETRLVEEFKKLAEKFNLQ